MCSLFRVEGVHKSLTSEVVSGHELDVKIMGTFSKQRFFVLILYFCCNLKEKKSKHEIITEYLYWKIIDVM